MGSSNHIYLSMVVVVLALLVACLFCFAKRVSQWIGSSGLNVLSRFVGLILMAMAWGPFGDGLLRLFPVWKGGLSLNTAQKV